MLAGNGGPRLFRTYGQLTTGQPATRVLAARFASYPRGYLYG
jgi:hypothetical protein